MTLGRGSVAVAAAVVYLGVALFALRVVLPSPWERMPYRAALDASPQWRTLDRKDQLRESAAVSRNAWKLVHEPSRLLEANCFPTPASVTLGEHMFGEGLFAVVPYALTREPVLTFNVILILWLWIAALAMYALAHHWTGDAGAAFVAGLLFAFHPVRVADPSHPFAVANQWTPLALLFAHRLFVRGGWADAAGLALFVGLQLLEAFYQVLALGILGGVYGIHLLVRHARRLPALAPKLLVTAAAVAAIAAAVMGPFLEARKVWDMHGHFSLLLSLASFAPGRSASPGSVALVLAAIGVLDRLRGPRGDDPRLVYLAAGLLGLWTAVLPIAIPALGVAVPSPLGLVEKYHLLPGLEMVRGLALLRTAVYLVTAFLAAYGMVALTARRRAPTRLAITLAVAVLALLELFHPALATRSFASPSTLAAHEPRPAPEVVALYEGMVDGPVLDLPLRVTKLGGAPDAAVFAFQGAFHQRPAGACAASFRTPVQEDVEALAARLPDAATADALHALGFRNVLVHLDLLPPARRVPMRRGLQDLAASGRVVPAGEAGGQLLLHLTSPLPVDATLAALGTPIAPADAASVTPPEAPIDFTFRNATAATYRHPDPIVPTLLGVRWQATAGGGEEAHEVRALLPLALAPGESWRRTLTVPVPSMPGSYTVTVAPAAAPDLVLATRPVVVEPGSFERGSPGSE
jgi:hypothetical protein